MMINILNIEIEVKSSVPAGMAGGQFFENDVHLVQMVWIRDKFNVGSLVCGTLECAGSKVGSLPGNRVEKAIEGSIR
jgi:hypothetical protein